MPSLLFVVILLGEYLMNYENKNNNVLHFISFDVDFFDFYGNSIRYFFCSINDFKQPKMKHYLTEAVDSLPIYKTPVAILEFIERRNTKIMKTPKEKA